MPIDYFVNSCKTSSKETRFGLCDDPPPASSPAYINENDAVKWIGIVNNKEQKEVHFNAIDNCIDIKKSDHKMDSRCDGILSYENNLIFVELKERKSKKWLKKGREQLTNTINRFKKETNVSTFSSIKGCVCNSLRPSAHVGQAVNIQKFKDDTGYILHGKREIDI